MTEQTGLLGSRAGARRDMNPIGTALIFLIILELIISYGCFLMIWAATGQPDIFQKSGHFAGLAVALAALATLAGRHAVLYPLTLLTATLIANILPFALCAHKVRVPVRPLFAKPRVSGTTVVIYTFVVLGVNLLVCYILNAFALLLSLFHLRLYAPNFSLPLSSPLGTVLMIFLLLIAAPVTEEFIFRGVVLNTLRRYGNGFAVVGSSLLWALLHGNVAQAVPVFFIGLFFGMLALRARSIRPTIAAHMANNLFSVLTTLAVGTKFLILRVTAGLFEIGLVIIAIVLFCVFYRMFFIEKSGERKSGGIGFAALFTSAAVLPILYNLYRIFTSVRRV